MQLTLFWTKTPFFTDIVTLVWSDMSCESVIARSPSRTSTATAISALRVAFFAFVSCRPNLGRRVLLQSSRHGRSGVPRKHGHPHPGVSHRSALAAVQQARLSPSRRVHSVQIQKQRRRFFGGRGRRRSGGACHKFPERERSLVPQGGLGEG